VLDKILSARATPGRAPAVSYFMPLQSTSGIRVDEDAALSFAAVFAATKAISETVSVLPWRVYEERGDERILQSGTTLDRTLHRRPNADMTAFTWREYMVACALLWGNAYAEIERDNAGEVIGLHPIHPSAIKPKRTDSGALVYNVQSDGGSSTDVPAETMYHLRGPTRDGIVGRSVISLARDSWGYGIAADQFANAFLGNGGTPSLVIQQGEGAPEMSAEGAQNMLSSFDRRHKGTKNAGKTAYLESGFEIKTVGVPQKDAQFIEQRRHAVVDVARWFRIPPHKIQSMDNATFSNIESQAIEFVTDAIQPWVERMEQEADAKLLPMDTRLITKMNINGLLRGDSAARSEYYAKLWNIGVYSVNDVRRLEDENPVSGGDQRFVPVNMVSLDQAAQQGGTTNPGAAMRGVFEEAHQRMIDKEQRAVERAHEQGKDMQTWAAEFYGRHAQHMREALEPAAKALGDVCGVDPATVSIMLKRHIEGHVERSVTDVSEKRWEAWGDRPAKATDQLMARIVERRE